MKIMWLCNVIPLPEIADDLGLPRPIVGGWLNGLAEGIRGEPSVELSVAFPIVGRTVRSGRAGGIAYYGFPVPRRWPLLPITDECDTSPRLRRILKSILESVQPDLLHVFGTEYGHALLAAQAFGRPERTLVHIQGLTSIIARHFLGSLPCSTRRRFAISNLIRGSLGQQVKRLSRRGLLEQETLMSVGHVAGRTEWDQACTRLLAPHAEYHYCSEVLRPCFYEARWVYEACEKHSILTTQGGNPLKGFYYLLEALPTIVSRFPSAHVYVAGTDPIGGQSMAAWAKRSAYGGYLRSLIDKYGLHSRVTFLGPLSEVEMRGQMLRAHVFVSTSTIENSSNALCEARLLGVPAVSSFVGGLPSIVRHGEDGFAYQHDAPYMLAHYVGELFSRPVLAQGFSHTARGRALRLHDPSDVVHQQLRIYSDMIES